MRKHHDQWKGHAPLDLKNLHFNIEQQHFEGNLTEDMHEIRDNMDKIIKNRHNWSNERNVIDDFILKSQS